MLPGKYSRAAAGDDPASTDRARALLFLGLGTLTFGSSSVLIRLCAFPSGIVASLRMLIAGLALLPFVAGRLRPLARAVGGRQLAALLVPGILLGLHFHLWVAGVRLTTVAAATFIFATNPVLFAAVEVALYRRRLALPDWLALALVVAGGGWLLASGGGSAGLGGTLLCFAATAVFVAYLVASEKLSRGIPHPSYVCLIYLAGGLLTLPLALLQAGTTAVPWTNGEAWLALAALALLPTLVGHASNTYAVRFFPPIVVSFTSLLEPLLSSLAALVVLGERPPAAELPSYLLFAGATALFLTTRWARGRIGKRGEKAASCSGRGDKEGAGGDQIV
jgi:drug/metabolite transporter (DMT)-like permease